MVECLTRDLRAAGSSLTGVTALWFLSKNINPSLVLVQPRKNRPYLTERLLMGRKESNQTKTKQTTFVVIGAVRVNDRGFIFFRYREDISVCRTEEKCRFPCFLPVSDRVSHYKHSWVSDSLLAVSGDKNISILHFSCRTSDLQLSLVLQTHALVLQ